MLRELELALDPLSDLMCIRQYAIAYRNVWHGLYELLIFWLLIWTKAAAGRKSIIFFTQRVRIRCCGFQSRGKIICQHRLELFCAPLSLGSAPHTLGHKLCVPRVFLRRFGVWSEEKVRFLRPRGHIYSIVRTMPKTVLFHRYSIRLTNSGGNRLGVAREKNVNLKYID